MRPFLREGGLRTYHQPNPAVQIAFLVMIVVFWAVVVYGLVMFINKYAKNNDAKGKADDALNIAKTRYAKGEISKDEFSALKKDLS